MKYRKTVSIVTYAKQGKKIYYLVLKRKLHWKGWEFPKGGIGKFETKRRAVKREIKEESGLDVKKIKKFNIKGKYKYHKMFSDRPEIIGNKYQLYSAEIKKGKIKIDKKEHSAYKWLEFEKAVKLLKWPSQKKCISIVHAWLKIKRKNNFKKTT